MPVEYPTLSVLVGELGVLPRAVRSELRRSFRAAGETALTKARSNAGWSSRIPQAISLRTSTRGPRTGVALRVDPRVPHARPYEGLRRGGGRTFRHPVFGGAEWVTQATRPYLRPAVDSVSEVVMSAARDAVQSAARSAGFR